MMTFFQSGLQNPYYVRNQISEEYLNHHKHTTEYHKFRDNQISKKYNKRSRSNGASKYKDKCIYNKIPDVCGGYKHTWCENYYDIPKHHRRKPCCSSYRSTKPQQWKSPQWPQHQWQILPRPYNKSPSTLYPHPSFDPFNIFTPNPAFSTTKKVSEPDVNEIDQNNPDNKEKSPNGGTNNENKQDDETNKMDRSDENTKDKSNDDSKQNVSNNEDKQSYEDKADQAYDKDRQDDTENKDEQDETSKIDGPDENKPDEYNNDGNQNDSNNQYKQNKSNNEDKTDETNKSDGSDENKQDEPNNDSNKHESNEDENQNISKIKDDKKDESKGINGLDEPKKGKSNNDSNQNESNNKDKKNKPSNEDEQDEGNEIDDLDKNEQDKSNNDSKQKDEKPNESNNEHNHEENNESTNPERKTRSTAFITASRATEERNRCGGNLGQCRPRNFKPRKMQPLQRGPPRFVLIPLSDKIAGRLSERLNEVDHIQPNEGMNSVHYNNFQKKHDFNDIY